MPFGLKRYQHTERPHFLTWSCYRRRQYFASSAMKDLFLDCLERVRRRYGFRVFGYVVMPEHVHLLVSEPDVELLATADGWPTLSPAFGEGWDSSQSRIENQKWF